MPAETDSRCRAGPPCSALPSAVGTRLTPASACGCATSTPGLCRQPRVVRPRAKGLGAPASRSSALDSVRLTAGGQFDLEPAPDLGARRHYDERVGHALWLRAVDLPPRTADDREFVTPLASLLTLATGSDCPPVAVEVATAPDQPCLTVPNAGLRADAEEAVPNPSPAAASGRIRFGRRRTVARRRNDTRPACPVVAAAAVGRGGGSYALLPRPLSRAWRDGRSLPRIGEACIRSKSTKPS